MHDADSNASMAARRAGWSALAAAVIGGFVIGWLLAGDRPSTVPLTEEALAARERAADVARAAAEAARLMAALALAADAAPNAPAAEGSDDDPIGRPAHRVTLAELGWEDADDIAAPTAADLIAVRHRPWIWKRPTRPSSITRGRFGPGGARIGGQLARRGGALRGSTGAFALPSTVGRPGRTFGTVAPPLAGGPPTTLAGTQADDLDADLRFDLGSSRGACCLDDGSCIDTDDRATCEALATGRFHGAGSDCSKTACPALGTCGWVVDAPFDFDGQTCGASGTCPDRHERSLAWEVTIPVADRWTFSVCGASFDTVLALGETCCATTPVANDDACGTASELVVDLQPGTYFLTLEGYEPAGCGDFRLTVSSPARPLYGGCCLQDQLTSCFELAATDCTRLGGVFLGDGRRCEQVVPRNVLAEPRGSLTLSTSRDASCPLPGLEVVTGYEQRVLIDPWITGTGDGGCASTWSAARCPLPAGFFGAGSQPFADAVCLRGVPLGLTAVEGVSAPLDFGNADTLLRRDDDPFAPCAAPSREPSSVGVTVERMRLEGVEPVVVRHDDGTTTTWHVQIDVEGGAAPSGGGISAWKEHAEGGRFNASISLCPTITFVNADDPSRVRVLEYCAACDADGLVLQAFGLPWVTAVAPSIVLPNPTATNFHPGVAPTTLVAGADCNGNGIEDTCDIADGVSLDANANRVPDECECVADLDGGGTVDFYDVQLILGAWGPCDPDAPCAGDLDASGTVDASDVMVALGVWGLCE